MADLVYLHPLWERLWHWVHALLILGLALTGLHLHWPDVLPLFGSLATAVSLHEALGWALILDLAAWLGFNLATGRLHHYLPAVNDLGVGGLRQARYYAWGIFRGEPHPYHSSPARKFNPLQRLSYAIVMFAMVPGLVISGLLFMHPLGLQRLAGGTTWVAVVALVHTLLAFGAAAFTVLHVYLVSTAPGLTSDLRSMVTGWKPAEPEH
jgi:thiosulfate reductase cytochrome b subunit